MRAIVSFAFMLCLGFGCGIDLRVFWFMLSYVSVAGCCVVGVTALGCCCLLVLKLLIVGLCFYASVKALWYVEGRLFRVWTRDWCLMLCRFMFWIVVFL